MDGTFTLLFNIMFLSLLAMFMVFHPAHLKCCVVQMVFHLQGWQRKGKQFQQLDISFLELNQAMVNHLPRQRCLTYRRNNHWALGLPRERALKLSSPQELVSSFLWLFPCLPRCPKRFPQRLYQFSILPSFLWFNLLRDIQINSHCIYYYFDLFVGKNIPSQLQKAIWLCS